MAMADKHDSIYEALPSPTSIRVILLAPGRPNDDIFCWTLPVDLDADHEEFPNWPRPTESISVASGSTSSGECRKFFLPIDTYFSDGRPEQHTHPFQRYSALSYVWGDPTNPKYISLDGEHRFPVTENLHAALRSLRQPTEGIRLWVDALCINQADYEEKKVQIGLMRRVYQQAKEVIAYIPLADQDQRNVAELVPKIIEAGKLVDEATASLNTQKKDSGEPEKPLSSALRYKDSSSTVWLDTKETDDREALTLQYYHDHQSDDHSLEMFGLPPVESLLWSSWRRLFASSYFERDYKPSLMYTAGILSIDFVRWKARVFMYLAF